MKQIKPINRAIARYTGLVAKWKREGAKGDVPAELEESLDELAFLILTYKQDKEAA